MCTNHDQDYKSQLSTENNTVNGLEGSRALEDHYFLKQYKLKVGLLLYSHTKRPLGKGQLIHQAQVHMTDSDDS